MDQDAQRVIADNRAQSDTKQLKKAIKEFYALLRPSLPPDQLEALHTSYSITLSQLSTHLTKSSRIRQVTAYEVAQYRTEQQEIDEQSDATRVKIEALKRRLAEAQQERSRRIEYDSKAKIILKLPDRAKGKESQEKLEDDIRMLKQEEQTYSETWSARKLAFDAIVSSLESMQEAIRDEKAEQERRRALDDAEDEEILDVPTAGVGAALDPNALPFVPGSTSAPVAPDEAGATQENASVGEEDEEMKGIEEEEATGTGTTPTAREEKEEGEESIEEGEMDTR
ncbi:hypothetical protein JCM11491_004526 [Sporobolomyces phaffii]